MLPQYSYGNGLYPYGNQSHGDLRLTVTSPIQSFAEPLSLAEVRDYLSLTPDAGNDDDDNLSRMISAARDVFEIEQNKDLIRKQWDLTLDYFPQAIELQEDLVSVDLVQYKDSDGTVHALVENTDYIVDLKKQPGLITPVWGTSWPSFTPWPSGAVLIRFTAGLSPTDAFWADEGERLKIGMKVLIKSWYIGDDSAEKGNQTGIPWAAAVLMRYGGIPRVG